MRAVLEKVAIRKAVGISLGEHDVSVVKLASTLAGPVETESLSEPCTPENVDEVIERLLMPLLGRKRRVPVAVGVTWSRLFFSTRLTPTGSTSKPESELRKTLSSTSLSDDMIIDMLRGSANRTPVARMVACRRKYLSSLVATLSRLGVRPLRTEPSPWALVRLAERQHHSPRWSKTVLRVFLGSTTGLVVAVSGGMPFGWKSFLLPAGSEGFAIVSAARGVKTQQAHYGIDVAADYAIIHGRPDLHERLQREEFASTMETRVIWHEGPSLDNAAIASGLALGCLSQDIKAFDLSRTLKARAPIKEIFPWGELIFASAAMGVMGLVLGAHAMKLDDSYAMLRTQNSQHACLAAGDVGRLEKDKKALEEKIAAIRNFAGSRVLWTTYTRDISERLPSNADLAVFNGRNALDCSGKSKAASGGFELRGTAPLSAEGAIPHNIDAFLGELAKDPLWNREFPTIATEIKLPPVNKERRSGVAEQPKIDFSILCVGRAPGEAPGKPEKAAKDVKTADDKTGDKDHGGAKNEAGGGKKSNNDNANTSGHADKTANPASAENAAKTTAAGERIVGKEAKPNEDETVREKAK
jgi:hypothetical protein